MAKKKQTKKKVTTKKKLTKNAKAKSKPITREVDANWQKVLPES